MLVSQEFTLLVYLIVGIQKKRKETRLISVIILIVITVLQFIEPHHQTFKISAQEQLGANLASILLHSLFILLILIILFSKKVKFYFKPLDTSKEKENNGGAF